MESRFFCDLFVSIKIRITFVISTIILYNTKVVLVDIYPWGVYHRGINLVVREKYV